MTVEVSDHAEQDCSNDSLRCETSQIVKAILDNSGICGKDSS